MTPNFTRDLVIVIWGIIAIVLVLIRLALVSGTLFFGRKGMKKLDQLTDEKVKPALSKALEIAQKIEARTAKLPGAPGSLGGPAEMIGAVQELKSIEPPFRSRKKTWLPFVG